MSRIAIIGAGHGGVAAAAAYGARGYDVVLCKLGTSMHDENFESIRQSGQITMRGILGESTVRVKATRDVEEAVSGASEILIFYVSNFHGLVAQTVVPHLRDGQLVVLGPGYCGSLFFLQEQHRQGHVRETIFVELETLPFTSRILSPGVVEITSQNVAHPIATVPAKRVNEAMNRLEPILGRMVKRDNVFEVALHNPNLVVHTVGTILSASRIEFSSGNFYMYREAFTPSVWNVVMDLDREKQAVLAAMGCEPRTYFEEFALRTFGTIDIDPMAGFATYADESPKGPSSLDTRYLTEDVPMGLGLLESLGRELGVPTPICSSLIDLASSLNGRNYRQEARTLQILWDESVTSLLGEFRPSFALEL